MGWLPWPCLEVFPELLMSVTFAKMHKALISSRLTFTSWNPSVKPTHNRGKLQNQNRHRHRHISWKRDCRHAHAHTHSQRIKTSNPFSMILSPVSFQAFMFFFLQSRNVPVLSAVSTLYLNSFASLWNGLDRNWWYKWKWHMLGIC